MDIPTPLIWKEHIWMLHQIIGHPGSLTWNSFNLQQFDLLKCLLALQLCFTKFVGLIGDSFKNKQRKGSDFHQLISKIVQKLPSKFYDILWRVGAERKCINALNYGTDNNHFH